MSEQVQEAPQVRHHNQLLHAFSRIAPVGKKEETAIEVGIRIAGYYNPSKGCAYPSTKRIAAEMGVHRNTVTNATNFLVQVGLLSKTDPNKQTKRELRNGDIDIKGAKFQNNRYTFNFELIKQLAFQSLKSFLCTQKLSKLCTNSSSTKNRSKNTDNAKRGNSVFDLVLQAIKQEQSHQQKRREAHRQAAMGKYIKKYTPPKIQTEEEYQAQFESENSSSEIHYQTAARNESAASFASGFFSWLGETSATLKRKNTAKAFKYRAIRNTNLARISKIFEEQGNLDYTEVANILKKWGDSSYQTLFLGPPGTGKTMLASRLCDLLPEMSDEEAMETASVASLTQSEINEHNWKSRPFRAPHHSSSMAALVGGGSVPRPGEISLAHNGLLFLDEMPEFDRKVLDSLREPLESGEIIISRAQGKTRFPARFQLVGALNPSPTGYYEGNQARTNPQAILRYLGRLSGPLLDRFDMSLEIPSLPKGTLAEGGDRGEPTELVKERVSLARESMLNRNGKVNALLGSREIEAFCPLQKSDAEFLETALHRLGLSIRAYHRIIKVARTIADLDGAEQIERSHLAEALGYRAMDRLLKQLTAQAV
ncbi:YifB family Mg chelatase-like AAA ATPase [Vibrio parahaemolyticus]|uniref:YifB family Mg chelatase-like AAA ATPase n=2 Tax=Vibrio parahaemolyticus TaxID=670 RepID=UPI000AE406A6|nr:YifB family Mg chelatase-like AAA ATPase [Vibrio parahaemolyticus]EGQ7739925.1 YifB family Mg chelatase-like AAA ATPase [Vibrio parahaemolyticus]EJG1398510.1 YifB family Mg chelatase-like AAA ATPase [Vibrio parahaemolyticus]